MIIKDIDSITTTDKFLRAGFNAEKQMAFYLKRAFGDIQDILVLNGIRLESDNDSAQIDHLIIHKYGMIIVESKSVNGTIEINDNGEWRRLGSPIGMPSPIEQAKMQAKFLKKYLKASELKPPKDKFIRNVFLNTTYEDINVDVLVAISNTGNIIRNAATDNICKAESIANKIIQLIEDYQRRDSLLNFEMKYIPVKLSAENRKEVAEFLIKSHTPLSVKHTEPTLPTPAPLTNEFHCRECGSTDISILYKYTYHFKCNKCNKNTPILKDNCLKCGQPLKLHKDGNQFYKQCKTCGTSNLFFTNAG